MGRVDPPRLIGEYLLLGLRFDRVEPGYVDAFTGDPELRRIVDNEPTPDPSALALRAEQPIPETLSGWEAARAELFAAHLRALACAGRKFAGEPVGFVDEVLAYF